MSAATPRPGHLIGMPAAASRTPAPHSECPRKTQKERGQEPFRDPDLLPLSCPTHSLVGEGGLEPPRPEGHWHLKPARLPFRHSPQRPRQLITIRTPPPNRDRSAQPPEYLRITINSMRRRPLGAKTMLSRNRTMLSRNRGVDAADHQTDTIYSRSARGGALCHARSTPARSPKGGRHGNCPAL